ncbi:uncharacterized protein NdufA3 [Tribolium castaneum]|uniref:Uncharacterized protein n=1 Tax=Tribolium castaneum TaxID=7070 RepID=A0A139WIC3_TRICA|nr:PREDICTED: uncharacterized protein LOC655647 [Tribolium castaneum]KYB27682.1 hypothetical protein TcasGA2_TC031168 [Tribolium castaneum]|eukprot:XP_967299.1 PREDICTED: uncharacterized protein LOC655647 [Tribolium castaneum]
MSASGRASIGLLKRGWHEIPDVMGSGVMALIGLGLGAISFHLYYNVKDGDNRRYKIEYTVIRHDDPRAEKVRKD